MIDRLTGPRHWLGPVPPSQNCTALGGMSNMDGSNCCPLNGEPSASQPFFSISCTFCGNMSRQMLSGCWTVTSRGHSSVFLNCSAASLGPSPARDSAVSPAASDGSRRWVCPEPRAPHRPPMPWCAHGWSGLCWWPSPLSEPRPTKPLTTCWATTDNKHTNENLFDILHVECCWLLSSFQNIRTFLTTTHFPGSRLHSEFSMLILCVNSPSSSVFSPSTSLTLTLTLPGSRATLTCGWRGDDSESPRRWRHQTLLGSVYLSAFQHRAGDEHTDLQVGVVLGPAVVVSHGPIVTVSVALKRVLTPEGNRFSLLTVLPQEAAEMFLHFTPLIQTWFTRCLSSRWTFT